MIIGRQVLLWLCGYISVCPTLHLSHSGVLGVGLGWVLKPGGPESFPSVRRFSLFLILCEEGPSCQLQLWNGDACYRYVNWSASPHICSSATIFSFSFSFSQRLAISAPKSQGGHRVMQVQEDFQLAGVSSLHVRMIRYEVVLSINLVDCAWRMILLSL